MSDAIFRRGFLKKCISSAFHVSCLFVLAESCSEDPPPDPCDNSLLNKEDIQKRTSMGFVEKSPSANKHCGNCNLWLPPSGEKSCGTCQLFKGSVPPEAYCIYWAPKV